MDSETGSDRIRRQPRFQPAFGLIAAAIADRVNRRNLMIAYDLVDSIVVATLPLAAAWGTLTLAHIYCVGLISATVWVWFDAANFGAFATSSG